MTASLPHITKHGILLQGTLHEFESEGVCNPGCYQDGNTVHFFYRAVRPGNLSTIGYCRLDGPLAIEERLPHPLMVPEHAYESQGLEDPRVVRIDGTIFMTYTGYDGSNALGALATGVSPLALRKFGIVTPVVSHLDFVRYLDCSPVPLNRKYYSHYQMMHDMGGLTSHHVVWDKDILLFPEKINGRYAMLHRLFPGIQIAYFDSPEELAGKEWVEYLTSLSEHIVMDPMFPHESSHIGGGCPPIATEHGWVMIYHAVRETPRGKVYTACASLLSRDDPRIEIARLALPLFSPELPWECRGVVHNVVFPSATALFGDTLYIYYGAADQRIGVASVSLDELVSALLKSLLSRKR